VCLAEHRCRDVLLCTDFALSKAEHPPVCVDSQLVFAAAGVARDAFPICLDTISMGTVVFDFRRFASKRAVSTWS
jgi:hypothetical protein